MVSPGAAAGLVLLVGINTLVAAVTVRFLRLYASTRPGTIAAIAVLGPILLFFATLVLSGVLQLGVDLQDRWVAGMVAIGLPLAVGATIDVLWMPEPDAVDDALAD